MMWGAYFPDDGEGPADAKVLLPQTYGITRIYDAEDAAKLACKMDYDDRGGWERGDHEFAIVIVAPDGTETRWQAVHERTITHTVREDDELEDQP